MPEQTKILSCDCQNTFQDEKYGSNQRVFVYALKNDNYRCTACGNMKRQASLSKKTEEKKKKKGKKK